VQLAHLAADLCLGGADARADPLVDRRGIVRDRRERVRRHQKLAQIICKGVDPRRLDPQHPVRFAGRRFACARGTSVDHLQIDLVGDEPEGTPDRFGWRAAHAFQDRDACERLEVLERRPCALRRHDRQ
jgi:hypothetical protein